MSKFSYEKGELKLVESVCCTCSHYASARTCKLRGDIPEEIWKGKWFGTSEKPCTDYKSSVAEMLENLSELTEEEQEICRLRKENKLSCFGCHLNSKCKTYKMNHKKKFDTR